MMRSDSSTVVRLAITMGDVAGIGPDIIADLLHRKDFPPDFHLLIIGNRSALRRTGRKAAIQEITGVHEWHTKVALLDPFDKKLKETIPGRPSLLTAEAAFCYLQTAARLAKERKISGMVTAPLSKEWIQKIEPGFTGHTEYLAGETGSFSMMLLGPNVYTGRMLRVALVTIHVSVENITPGITRKTVVDKLEVLRKGLPSLGVPKPRIAVCGLNPHAGEGGLLGNREREEIEPAIKEARSKGIDAEGPFPADTLFMPETVSEFDAVLAMYHDQGLIPLKQVTGRKSVNVTLGLNIIRTSVDHGTAYNLAGTGQADSSSLSEAVKLAGKMSLNS